MHFLLESFSQIIRFFWYGQGGIFNERLHETVNEGELVPADGVIKQLNDFSVNESILTGESFSVIKDLDSKEKNTLYSGTLADSGQCVYEVTAIGEHTQLGLLGKSIQNIQKEKNTSAKANQHFRKMDGAGRGYHFSHYLGH